MQTALIVDDEPYLRTWLHHFFQERGFQTRVCAGVSEALNELNTMCFDLVLTDYNMPDGTGGIVLQTAKVRCPNAVRALMTGVLATVPEAHKAVAHHLYEKPLLVGALHDLLEATGSVSAAANSNRNATSAAVG